ncbi:MAG: hypothetical protein ABIR98_03290 [Usitatibacter sp.]
MSEVGPRDGMQSIKRAMPAEAKHRWIRALADAGLREIEVATFVPPRFLPQRDFIRTEHAKWGTAVRDANIKRD